MSTQAAGGAPPPQTPPALRPDPRRAARPARYACLAASRPSKLRSRGRAARRGSGLRLLGGCAPQTPRAHSHTFYDMDPTVSKTYRYFYDTVTHNQLGGIVFFALRRQLCIKINRKFCDMALAKSGFYDRIWPLKSAYRKKNDKTIPKLSTVCRESKVRNSGMLCVVEHHLTTRSAT